MKRLFTWKKDAPLERPEAALPVTDLLQMKKSLLTLLGILVVLALPVFLVLSNANLFMTPQFVYYEYGKPDFPTSPRFDAVARTQFAVATVRYTRGELNNADLANLGVYNDRELSHMRDVQVLAGQVLPVNYGLGILILLALFALWRTASSPLLAWRTLFDGAVLTLLLMVALGLFALFAFDSFFVLFHRIFFVGDSWLFPVTDSLIQFYPEPLWVDAAMGIALFTILEALILVAVTFNRGKRAAAPRA